MSLIYDVSNGWPGGISDGITIGCGICGELTNFDYFVKDEFWTRIIPKRFQRGVVCLDCIDKLTKENGEVLSHYLERVQYTGINETIVLTPEITFVYDTESEK